MAISDEDLQGYLTYGFVTHVTNGLAMDLVRELVAERERSKIAAQDVLAMAYAGNMPDSYWQTDRRIARACKVLGIKPEEALAVTQLAFEVAEAEEGN